MNPIQYALAEIHRRIPASILQKTFMPQRYHQLRRDPFMPASIDEQIIEKVINGPVRRDCDTAGATEAVIPLMGLTPEFISNDKYVYHIPKERTNGREITSALAIIFYAITGTGVSGPLGNNFSVPGTGTIGFTGPTMGQDTSCCNSLSQPLAAMTKSLSPMAFTQSSNVRIINGSTLLVEDIMVPNTYPHLRCILANDATFSTLAPAAWKAFAKLCVLACKEHIYRTLIIEIDTAELVGGKELGRFKEIVESYSDAEEQYEEYYHETWRKIQFMSDDYRHTRFIKSLIGKFK